MFPSDLFIRQSQELIMFQMFLSAFFIIKITDKLIILGLEVINYFKMNIL
jgi:hypothetical protein